MTDRFEQLVKESKQVGLTPEERLALRREVETIASPRARRPYLKSLSVLVLLLLVGGGVASAAEGSVPGDLLYPIKTEVNEPLRAALTFNTEAKAKLQVEFAKRRLEEADKLSAKGGLKDGAEAEIAGRLETHIKAAQQSIADLHDEGKDDEAEAVKVEIHTALQTHKDEGETEPATVSAKIPATAAMLASSEEATSSEEKQGATTLQATIDKLEADF